MISLMTPRGLRAIGLALGFALSLMLGSAVAASAADLPVGGATGPEVAALFRDLGYPVDMATDKDGDPLIHTKAAATNVDSYFYNCATAAGGAFRCNSIQFAAGFSIPSVALTTINNWNRDKRYGRAYISAEGFPFMEVDIDISGGASMAQIRAYVRHLESLLPDFRKAIGYTG
jgi:hypothetical protein